MTASDTICRSSVRLASLRRGDAAYTLLEVMIVVGIWTLIMAAVMQSWLFTSRSMVALGNYNDLNQASENTLDNMTRDIRQARVVGYFNTNTLTCSNLDGTSFTYTWDPSSQKVCKIQAGQSTVYLTCCTYFCFSIWLRNPTNQFWFPYSATNQPDLTKLVNVSWRCSRKILNQYNTESVQTAKIVLRN